MYAEYAGEDPDAPAATALVEPHRQRAWVLRRWDRRDDDLTLWANEDSALRDLGRHVRSNWANIVGRDNVPDQPPTDDREAVRLYYGPTQERGDEGYGLYAEAIHTSAPPVRTRLVAQHWQFPGEEDCDRANRSAVFHPVRAEGQPCIEVEGVLVFLYLDPDEEAVRVSIHLDTVADRLIRPDDTVPLRVVCESTVIFDDSDQSSAGRNHCSAPSEETEPAASHSRTLEVLADLRGNMVKGYTSETVNSVLGRITSASGYSLVCVWDYFDEFGTGGNSQFYIQQDPGQLRELAGDLWTWLNGSPEDPNTPASPGVPSSWLGRIADITTEDLRYTDGFHNYARRNETIQTDAEGDA
ncbi:hypothetical protein ACFY4C_41560 [Actinomadura viridis]|uniref:hypothetical protein n=1 Tax=Actinomadura viridis TaxID=58110 RepID=UPI0036B6C081